MTTKSYQSILPYTTLYEPLINGKRIYEKSEASSNGTLKHHTVEGPNNNTVEKSDPSNFDTFVFDENYEGDSKSDNIVYHIVWHLLFYWIITHVGAMYGIYLIFTKANLYTTFFSLVLGYGAGVGVTAGAHRLWCHRAYKAKWPLKALLVLYNSISASSTSIWNWCVIHRVHHKYSDTDADPVNSKRGFWYSHIGWTIKTVHPKVIEKVKCIDLSDLEADPFIRFNRKHYMLLNIIFCLVIPTFIPVYFWTEDILTSFLICGILRHLGVCHATFVINSFAHLYGRQPYNKNINPRENFWANLYTQGEGYHNYHHTFPMDYRASEFQWKFNGTTLFIDIMAMIGWAYDLKTATPDVISNTKEKKGDVHEKGPYGPVKSKNS